MSLRAQCASPPRNSPSSACRRVTSAPAAAGQPTVRSSGIRLRTIISLTNAVAYTAMPASAAARRPTAADVLARGSIRPTRQRVRVLEALAEERNDATAQEIHERLRARGDRIG